MEKNVFLLKNNICSIKVETDNEKQSYVEIILNGNIYLYYNFDSSNDANEFYQFLKSQYTSNTFNDRTYIEITETELNFYKVKK